MPTLIATPGAVNANSYATLEFASVYLQDSRLYAQAWTNATPSDQERALIWATKLLDDWFLWYGVIRNRNQRLLWPRSAVYGRDGFFIEYDVIPNDISEATSELALELLKRDRTAQPELAGLGFRSAKVGEISVEVDSSETVVTIPENVLSIVSHLGVLMTNAGGVPKITR